jgi:hypothetical protein
MRISRHRNLLAAFVALIALGASVSASASAALPEFKSSKYPVTFTGAGAAAHFQEKGGGSYTCISSSISGEITGPNELSKVVVKFVGPCGGFCKQKGLESWETKELKGSLGYVSKPSQQVGLLLEAVTAPIANCERAGGQQKWKIQGSFIGQITPVRQMVKTFTLNYQQKEGVDGVRKFEGEEALHALQMITPNGTSIEAGMEIHEGLSLTTSQAIEIRS